MNFGRGAQDFKEQEARSVEELYKDSIQNLRRLILANAPRELIELAKLLQLDFRDLLAAERFLSPAPAISHAAQ